MCLAIPAQIEQLDGDKAVVGLAGNHAPVNTALVPSAKVGDWVLVHAGYAITVLDEKEARETYELLKSVDAI